MHIYPGTQTLGRLSGVWNALVMLLLSSLKLAYFTLPNYISPKVFQFNSPLLLSKMGDFYEHFKNFVNEQESIPIGCVPPACQLYLSGHQILGLCSEVQCIMGNAPPPSWTDGHTPVKKLPSHNFFGGRKYPRSYWERDSRCCMHVIICWKSIQITGSFRTATDTFFRLLVRFSKWGFFGWSQLSNRLWNRALHAIRF